MPKNSPIKLIFIIALAFLCSFGARSQILCIYCFDDSSGAVNPLTTTLIQNGGFEVNTAVVGSMICPAATFYTGLNVGFWTCTGGGASTYATVQDGGFNTLVPEGNLALYLGNAYTEQVCASFDLSCLLDSNCLTYGLDTNLYPTHAIGYGGRNGVSIEQSVAGLVPSTRYILEFWVGGEDVGTGSSGVFAKRSIFSVDIGFGKIILPCYPTAPASTYKGTRYAIVFNAVSSTHTIKYTNWGHICDSCTEVVLDDVRLYEQRIAANPLTCDASALIQLQKDTFVCEGDSIQLNGRFYSDSAVVNTQIQIADTIYQIQYHIRVVDCSATHFIKVPNAFTPNDDVYNDFFIVYGRNLSAYTIRIFNRWGEVVYQSNDLTELNIRGWDGKYKGESCDVGTYTYVIQSTSIIDQSNKVSKGNLTLIK